MANRFDRLFQLPPNQYSEGSPVILAAGVLLKDNETGSIIAQLKFQSVSEKRIKAVKVSLSAFDISRTEVQGVPDYQYLEMNISNGQEFGGNKAIVMPNSVTRSFSVDSIVIVFHDGSMWESRGQFVTLPTAKPLSLTLGGAELEKQYRIATNASAQYTPAQEQDLWQCSCGTWNSGVTCTHCRIFKEKVFSSLDIAVLTDQTNIRLAAEAEQKRLAAEIKAERKAEQEANRKAIFKKIKIAATMIIPVVIIALLFSQWLWPDIVRPAMLYKEANQLMAAGSYQEAISLFEELGNYKDSADKIQNCKTAILETYYSEAHSLMNKGNYREAAFLFELAANQSYKDAAEKLNEVVSKLITSYQRATIDAGFDHVIGLKKDGTVISAGSNQSGQCNTDGWSNIIAVSAGGYHTVGLKEDGTVVATGDNEFGQCNVSSWKNIVAICAGSYHTVGLTKDGQVVGAGDYYSGYKLVSTWEKELSSWDNFYAIGAGNNFTIGIRNDHTVVAIGSNEYGQCNTSGWKNIYALAVSSGHTVGLRDNGSVVATGIDFRDCGQCNVSDCKHIIAISAGSYHTVGLQANGKVVAVGYNEYCQCDVLDWENVIAVAADGYFTVALMADGTVVATGSNEYGQCNVSDWKDIQIP